MSRTTRRASCRPGDGEVDLTHKSAGVRRQLRVGVSSDHEQAEAFVVVH